MNSWKIATIIAFLAATLLSGINTVPLQRYIRNTDAEVIASPPSLNQIQYDAIHKNYHNNKDIHCRIAAVYFPQCIPDNVLSYENPARYFIDFPSKRIKTPTRLNQEIYNLCSKLPVEEFSKALMEPKLLKKFKEIFPQIKSPEYTYGDTYEFHQSSMTDWLKCFDKSYNVFTKMPRDHEKKTIERGQVGVESKEKMSEKTNQGESPDPSKKVGDVEAIVEDTNPPLLGNQGPIVIEDKEKMTGDTNPPQSGIQEQSINEDEQNANKNSLQTITQAPNTEKEEGMGNTQDSTLPKPINQDSTITTEDIKKNGDKTKTPPTEVQEQVATEGKQNENENKSQTNKHELDANKEDGSGIRENQNGADKSIISDDGNTCVDEAEIYDLCPCKSSAAQIGQTFMPVAVSTVLLTALKSSSV